MMVITSGKVFLKEETRVCDTGDQYSRLFLCYFLKVL